MQTKWTLEFHVSPSLEAQHAGVEPYAILIHGPHDEAQEKCIVWMQKDAGLWFTPWHEMPKDEISTEYLSAKEASSLFEGLASTRLPAASHVVYGFDSVTYTLRISSGFNKSEFQWFDSLPAEWSELACTVEKINEYAKSWGVIV